MNVLSGEYCLYKNNRLQKAVNACVNEQQRIVNKQPTQINNTSIANFLGRGYNK